MPEGFLDSVPVQLLVFVLGALWGSFFNVCIARVPAGESVVSPPSHCRRCGARVRWYDNVPIASYLALGGRCRACRERFSPRYALVELLSALIAVAIWRHDAAFGAAGARAAAFLVHFAFAGVLVVLSFIDLDTCRIPDPVTYPAIPILVVASLLLGLPHRWDGAAGAAAGYLVFRLLGDVYWWITGREGMGLGDAKLLAVIGAVLGWQALLPVVFLGSMQGAIVGVAAAVLRRPIPTPTDPDEPPPSSSLRHVKIPFGPFLSAAALEVLLLGDQLRALWPLPGAPTPTP